MKKILFVNESLAAAGGEKSLLSLLSQIDYTKYEVDLQLFAYGGELESYLPKSVNLLPPLDYTRFLSLSFRQQLKSGNLRFVMARILYSLYLRLFKRHGNQNRACNFWKISSKCFGKSKSKYDVAVAYAQNLPTFYVADKVSADKKISWVNTDYHIKTSNWDYLRQYYNCYDSIVCVSDSSHKVFNDELPEMASKTTVIWDIHDVGQIISLAEDAENDFDKTQFNILTVGRLAYEKGIDIAIDACKILKKKGLSFKWYVLGKGPCKEELERQIKLNNLEDRFILLGVRSNPYPYFKDADLYVQTSRHEGYGLAIAEARILNTPVVTTEFDAVYDQMKQGINGLVVPFVPAAIADAIEKLMTDKSLYDSIAANLKNEKKGNYEEYDKFVNLIES